jgi:hypothetical protein
MKTDVSGNLRTGHTVGNSTSGGSGGQVKSALDRPIVGGQLGPKKKISQALESGTVSPKSDIDSTSR